MLIGAPDDRITIEDVQNIRAAVDEAMSLVLKHYGTATQRSSYGSEIPRVADPVGPQAIRTRLSKAAYTADKIERRLAI
jgi:phage baseplate assembly protein W